MHWVFYFQLEFAYMTNFPQPSSSGFETSFDLSNKLNGSGGDFDANNVGGGTAAAEQSSRILDDPFDAEWAALATRNNSKNTNPFKSSEDGAAVVGDGSESDFKAFELQM